MLRSKKTQFAIRKLSKGAGVVLLSFGILSSTAAPLVSAATTEQNAQDDKSEASVVQSGTLPMSEGLDKVTSGAASESETNSQTEEQKAETENTVEETAPEKQENNVNQEETHSHKTRAANSSRSSVNYDPEYHHTREHNDTVTRTIKFIYDDGTTAHEDVVQTIGYSYTEHYCTYNHGRACPTLYSSFVTKTGSWDQLRLSELLGDQYTYEINGTTTDFVPMGTPNYPATGNYLTHNSTSKKVPNETVTVKVKAKYETKVNIKYVDEAGKETSLDTLSLPRGTNYSVQELKGIILEGVPTGFEIVEWPELKAITGGQNDTHNITVNIKQRDNYFNLGITYKDVSGKQIDAIDPILVKEDKKYTYEELKKIVDNNLPIGYKVTKDGYNNLPANGTTITADTNFDITIEKDTQYSKLHIVYQTSDNTIVKTSSEDLERGQTFTSDELKNKALDKNNFPSAYELDTDKEFDPQGFTVSDNKPHTVIVPVKQVKTGATISIDYQLKNGNSVGSSSLTLTDGEKRTAAEIKMLLKGNIPDGYKLVSIKNEDSIKDIIADSNNTQHDFTVIVEKDVKAINFTVTYLGTDQTIDPSNTISIPNGDTFTKAEQLDYIKKNLPEGYIIDDENIESILNDITVNADSEDVHVNVNVKKNNEYAVLEVLYQTEDGTIVKSFSENKEHGSKFSTDDLKKLASDNKPTAYEIDNSFNPSAINIDESKTYKVIVPVKAVNNFGSINISYKLNETDTDTVGNSVQVSLKKGDTRSAAEIEALMNANVPDGYIVKNKPTPTDIEVTDTNKEFNYVVIVEKDAQYAELKISYKTQNGEVVKSVLEDVEKGTLSTQNLIDLKDKYFPDGYVLDGNFNPKEIVVDQSGVYELVVPVKLNDEYAQINIKYTFEGTEIHKLNTINLRKDEKRSAGEIRSIINANLPKGYQIKTISPNVTNFTADKDHKKLDHEVILEKDPQYAKLEIIYQDQATKATVNSFSQNLVIDQKLSSEELKNLAHNEKNLPEAYEFADLDQAFLPIVVTDSGTYQVIVPVQAKDSFGYINISYKTAKGNTVGNSVRINLKQGDKRTSDEIKNLLQANVPNGYTVVKLPENADNDIVVTDDTKAFEYIVTVERDIKSIDYNISYKDSSNNNLLKTLKPLHLLNGDKYTVADQLDYIKKNLPEGYRITNENELKLQEITVTNESSDVSHIIEVELDPQYAKLEMIYQTDDGMTVKSISGDVEYGSVFKSDVLKLAADAHRPEAYEIIADKFDPKTITIDKSQTYKVIVPVKAKENFASLQVFYKDGDKTIDSTDLIHLAKGEKRTKAEIEALINDNLPEGFKVAKDGMPTVNDIVADKADHKFEYVIKVEKDQNYGDIKVSYKNKDGHVISTLPTINLPLDGEYKAEDIRTQINSNIPDGYKITQMPDLSDGVITKDNRHITYDVTVDLDNEYAKLNVNYVDGNGQAIKEAKPINLNLTKGESYTAAQLEELIKKNIPEGYIFKSVGPELSNITATTKDQKFNYKVVLEKDPEYANVQVSFVTDDGMVVKTLPLKSLEKDGVVTASEIQEFIKGNTPEAYKVKETFSPSDITVTEAKTYTVEVPVVEKDDFASLQVIYTDGETPDLPTISINLAKGEKRTKAEIEALINSNIPEGFKVAKDGMPTVNDIEAVTNGQKFVYTVVLEKDQNYGDIKVSYKDKDGHIIGQLTPINLVLGGKYSKDELMTQINNGIPDGYIVTEMPTIDKDIEITKDNRHISYEVTVDLDNEYAKLNVNYVDENDQAIKEAKPINLNLAKGDSYTVAQLEELIKKNIPDGYIFKSVSPELSNITATTKDQKFNYNVVLEKDPQYAQVQVAFVTDDGTVVQTAHVKDLEKGTTLSKDFIQDFIKYNTPDAYKVKDGFSPSDITATEAKTYTVEVPVVINDEFASINISYYYDNATDDEESNVGTPISIKLAKGEKRTKAEIEALIKANLPEGYVLESVEPDIPEVIQASIKDEIIDFVVHVDKDQKYGDITISYKDTEGRTISKLDPFYRAIGDNIGGPDILFALRRNTPAGYKIVENGMPEIPEGKITQDNRHISLDVIVDIDTEYAQINIEYVDKDDNPIPDSDASINMVRGESYTVAQLKNLMDNNIPKGYKLVSYPENLSDITADKDHKKFNYKVVVEKDPQYSQININYKDGEETIGAVPSIFLAHDETRTAAQLLELVNKYLPKGYKVTDSSSLTDITAPEKGMIYTFDVQVAKVLDHIEYTVSYKDSDGKTIETIDKIHVHNGETYSKADQEKLINDNIPDGYRVAEMPEITDIIVNDDSTDVHKTVIVEKDPEYASVKITFETKDGMIVKSLPLQYLEKDKTLSKEAIQKLIDDNFPDAYELDGEFTAKDITATEAKAYSVVVPVKVKENFASLQVFYKLGDETISSTDLIQLAKGEKRTKAEIEALINSNLPKGYEIAENGMPEISDIQATTNGQEFVYTVSLKVTTTIITPDDVKDPEKEGLRKNVTRTILVHLPGQNKPTKVEQVVTFERNKIISLGNVSYTDWKVKGTEAEQGTWEEYSIPQVDGYNSYVGNTAAKSVSAKDVTESTEDETVEINYRAMDQMKINITYKDKDGKIEDKNGESISLKGDESLTLNELKDKITTDLPSGYHIYGDPEGMPNKDVAASDFEDGYEMNIVVTIEKDEKDAYEFEDGDLIKRHIRQIYITKDGERHLAKTQVVTFVRKKTYIGTIHEGARYDHDNWEYGAWELHRDNPSGQKWESYAFPDGEKYHTTVKYPKIWDDPEDREVVANEVEEREVHIPAEDNDNDEVRVVDVTYGNEENPDQPNPPVDPDPDDPNKPGTDDPDKPNPDQPDNPGTDDPDKPNPDQPDNPGNDDKPDDNNGSNNGNNSGNNGNNSDGNGNNSGNNANNGSSNGSNGSGSSSTVQPLPDGSISSLPNSSSQDKALAPNSDLPQTGEKDNQVMQTTGIIAVVLAALTGVGSFFFTSKKKKEDK